MSETNKTTMKVIARINNGFTDKFGIPRQSGIANGVKSTIVFEKEFRCPDAVRGLEGFSHIWLIWEFSQSHESSALTVRPPRLGGNKRVGVFATRSPYRPNPIGLSCVKLTKIEYTSDRGPVLHVDGADLMNGTPIYDIKPYLPEFDCISDADAGFAKETSGEKLKVIISKEFSDILGENETKILTAILANDPRPSYQNDPKRVYGFEFNGREIKFTVQDKVLEVKEIFIK
ncbi:MAG: tRNA (N6-threonylcarbamoyladenosine(37)-N6)-methyltransferase TrmO [Acutalibacteraceae bacterium]